MRLLGVVIAACAACGGGSECAHPDSLFQAWVAVSFTVSAQGAQAVSPLNLSAGRYGFGQQFGVVSRDGTACTYSLDLEKTSVGDGTEGGTFALTNPSPNGPACGVNAVSGRYRLECSTLTLSNAYGVAVYHH